MKVVCSLGCGNFTHVLPIFTCVVLFCFVLIPTPTLHLQSNIEVTVFILRDGGQHAWF